MIAIQRQEAIRNLWFPESPVVAIDKLVEVCRQLGIRHSVKLPEPEAGEVRYGDVHPTGELFW